MPDTIFSAFAARAAAAPAATAVITPTATVSFAELLRLAEAMVAPDWGPGRSVGIVTEHGPRQIAAMLAVLRSGARYVPAEPDSPPARVSYMLRDAGVDCLLTDRPAPAELSDLPARRPEPASPAATGPERALPASPAYVLYTSGTTGRPKGVCIAHANVCHYARAFAAVCRPRPGDVMLQNSVCSFDIFVEEVFAALLNGVAVAVPPAGIRHDPAALMAFVARHRVTMLSGFPYLLARLNRLPRLPPSLRLLISGGDVLRAGYVDRLLPQATVFNSYGPSETTVCATFYRCNAGAPLADGTYPVGRPLPGVTISVTDDRGRELPVGEPGEIVIGGAGVGCGYVGAQTAANAAFVTLPDGTRIYRTGDRGCRLPDGNLAFLCRLDTQVMIRGQRVETAEVEACLHRCPGVIAARVLPRQDEFNLPYLTAYVVPAAPPPALSALRRALAAALPAFMIPEFFVFLDHFPLNANGKPDPHRLPAVMKIGQRP